MAKVTFEDDGWEELVQELQAETLEDGKAAVRAAAELLVERLSEKVSGQRYGFEYRVPRTKAATYRASKPNEPPAVATSTLKNNIAFTEPEYIQEEIRSKVGVDLNKVPYARRLEYGGGHMAPNGRLIYIHPRPWLRSGFMENSEDAAKLMQDLLR
jgi:hypothetical protein